MRLEGAIAVIERHFPGAVETVDTSSAGHGIGVDELGQLWPDRCDCGRHPYQGHPAKPVARKRSAA